MMLTCTRTRPAPKISTPDYTGTGDLHNPTSSQSHRPIILLPRRPNGNHTGKLQVRVYPRVGSPRSVGSEPDPTRRYNRIKTA